MADQIVLFHFNTVLSVLDDCSARLICKEPVFIGDSDPEGIVFPERPAYDRVSDEPDVIFVHLDDRMAAVVVTDDFTCITVILMDLEILPVTVAFTLVLDLFHCAAPLGSPVTDFDKVSVEQFVDLLPAHPAEVQRQHLMDFQVGYPPDR